ncbi:hypothetical protein GOP47_0017676 [Adiantum capillus-veneris]|uniref:Endonuclease/exonuclease/phosphatase domain-containing protein n=1 Tax=Adiantum capillus-veneris TaxID=13818 RepID=A0A9D4Z9E5_ADICA|nr:hypothetical protein GOP47_0017676 [Adiantum capillus-veneris]
MLSSDSLQILLLCLRACVSLPITGVIRPSCRLCSLPLQLASPARHRDSPNATSLFFSSFFNRLSPPTTEGLHDHTTPVAAYACKRASAGPEKSCLSMVLLKAKEEEACQPKDPQDKDDHVCGLPSREDMEKIRSASYPKNAKQAAGGQARICLEEEFQFLAPRVTSDASISCTTFNILAPIYKRVGNESCRESHFHDVWLSRNQRILDMLLLLGSSIICLQEFWLENEELVQLYDRRLRQSGYTMYKLARSNNKGDGLLTAIRMDRLRVLNYKELFFYDCGDRVAQIFHLCLKAPFDKRDHLDQDVLLVNTHLLFPHDSTFCPIRLRQVHKIIESLVQYEKENGLPSVPVILCGDWNGSKRGHVYKFLRSQGFVSSYDAVHSYTDNDAHRWISHRNHRGDVCGVDFIWLRNPTVQKRLTSASWTDALFGMLKSKVCEGGISEEDAPCLSESNKDPEILTRYGFERRLHQGMAPVSGLSKPDDSSTNASGFGIHDAYLFPPEVEKGFWPEDYSLSDHAPLTAVFEPIKEEAGFLHLVGHEIAAQRS